MLLLVKVKNAAGLLWDSLDQEERRALMYVTAWLLLTSLAALAKASEKQLVGKVADEVERRGR